jgi:NAD(P)-dependent dehydrogenase (short-subunit alcohol dehydrogenase family)
VTDQIVDRVSLITGATSGIGKATAQVLAAIGAPTVLVARDAARGEVTVEEIRRTTGSDRVDVLVADLSSQDSIRELAKAFRRHHDRLDVLVNCAGAFFRERRVTVDGLEMTFALNHLAYFLLTNQLLDVLRRSGSARVLNVTAPATTRIDFDDLQSERRYRPFTAFGASKVANLMFTFELARRLEGTEVTVNGVHPGRVRSSIMRKAPAPFRMLTWLLSGSAERAGRSVADLATAPELLGRTGRF